jgi:hypothetical protein
MTDIFPYLTDRERAAGYLKRSPARRPKAPPLRPTERKLVPVDGWPDGGDTDAL